MINILRLHGKPILNFADLRNEFSAPELCEQMEAFLNFAAVHCVPLSSLLKDRETGERYPAEYLTKEFWQGVLRQEPWPGEADAWGCFRGIVESRTREWMEQDELDEESLPQLEKEIADSRAEEKLLRISGLCEEGAGTRKVLSLLAVCELAEADALALEAGDWKSRRQREKTAGTPGGPELFLFERTACLPVGNEPCRYWYHDSDRLSPGAAIRTVKVEAAGSDNRYAVLRIELYSEQSGQCVQQISLRRGEYRYCNVSRGRIIKFLPSVCVSDELCLMRASYDAPALTVCPCGAEEWTLNTENTSSFSVGTKSQGFLLVREGKINSRFYRAAEDYFVRLKLDLIPLPVVESAVTPTGYALLLEDGSVVSGDSGERTDGAVSLSPAGRCPLLTVEGRTDWEAAISPSGGSAAVLGGEGMRACVIFASDAKEFTVRQNGNRQVLCLRKEELGDRERV